MSEEVFQDVDYIDENDKYIHGEVMYYTTSQVAKILDISDSKVRYYSSVFCDILDIEYHNKQRRFTKVDIEKFKAIIELKNNGMTLKQIQEYCLELNDKDNNQIENINNNTINLQLVVKMLIEEQNNIFERQEQLIKNLEEKVDNLENSLRLSQDRMAEYQKDLQDNFHNALMNNMDKYEKEFIKHDEKIISVLKNHMEENRKMYEDNKKKSLFYRIFKI